MMQSTSSDNPGPHCHRDGFRIIQVHPTLNCNLRCSHCYSESAPGLKSALDLGDLQFFLNSAFDEGFNTLAVSGGEPLLYHDLAGLLAFTKAAGYYNSVTTNGTLLSIPKYCEPLQYLDLIAMSVDGGKEAHNAMRQSEKAWDQLLEGIAVVQALKMKYGFIHTLRNEPLEIIPFLCEFTLQNKGKLLQFHPLENAGRGKNLFADLHLTEEQYHQFFILFHYFRQKHEQDFSMQLDLLHSAYLQDNPQVVYVFEDEVPVSQYLKELTVDEHGYILPVCHGFNRSFALGNIKDRKPLRTLLAAFEKEKLQLLKNMYGQVYSYMVSHTTTQLFNYPELLNNLANEEENFMAAV